jgi:hypothetical protein
MALYIRSYYDNSCEATHRDSDKIQIFHLYSSKIRTPQEGPLLCYYNLYYTSEDHFQIKRFSIQFTLKLNNNISYLFN